MPLQVQHRATRPSYFSLAMKDHSSFVPSQVFCLLRLSFLVEFPEELAFGIPVASCT